MMFWIALGLLLIQIFPLWGVEAKFSYKTFMGGRVHITEDGRIIYALSGGDGARIEKVLKNAEIEGVVGVGKLLGGFWYGFKSEEGIFRAVSFGEVYEGISFELTAHGEGVSEAFLIKSGADPSRIVFKVEGAKRLKIDPAMGALIVETQGGVLFVFYPAAAYQYAPPDIVIEVPVRYRIISEDTYGFEVEGELEEGLPLVIWCFGWLAIGETSKNEGK